MNEILKAVSSHESTDDPQQWTANLEEHVATYEVSWTDVIFYMKIFFSDTDDDEVKAWWKSDHRKLRQEQRDEKDPYLMWQDMLKEQRTYSATTNTQTRQLKLTTLKLANSAVKWNHMQMRPDLSTWCMNTFQQASECTYCLFMNQFYGTPFYGLMDTGAQKNVIHPAYVAMMYAKVPWAVPVFKHRYIAW